MPPSTTTSRSIRLRSGAGSGCRSITTATASSSGSRSDALPHGKQQGDQRHQRLRRRDPAQRLHRGLGQHGIGNERHQRTDRVRITDLAQRRDGRELQPEVALEQAAERGHRFADPQLAGSLDRRLRDVRVGMLEQRQDRRSGGGVADPREALEREQHQLGVVLAEHLEQVGNGVGALPLERGEARVATDRVGAVGHELAQHRGLDVPRREADGAVTHARRRVLQRREDVLRTIGPPGGLLEGRQPASGRGDEGAHTWSSATRCRRASDSPARLFAAPFICSTATRFWRETTAIASTAFTTISPPCFCSSTASDIWWVSWFIFWAAALISCAPVAFSLMAPAICRASADILPTVAEHFPRVGGLLVGRGRRLRHQARRLADGLHDAREYVLDQRHRALGVLLHRLDHGADLLGRGDGALRQPADLVGHDGEALAGVARAGGLDRRVECQQVGLVRDALDHLHDLPDFVGPVADGGDGLLQPLAVVPGIA